MGTRRLCVVLVVTVTSVALGTSLTGCATGSHKVSSGSHRVSNCGRDALRLSLQTQGTATQAVVFLSLRNRSGSECVASGTARFEVEQSGHPAKISGNPSNVSVNARILPGRARLVANAWWFNWCGSRRDLRIAVHLDGTIVRWRFNALPVCLSRRDKSRLTGSPLDIPR